MAYLKDLVIILVIMLSKKLKNIKWNIIKSSGNLKLIFYQPCINQINQVNCLMNIFTA